MNTATNFDAVSLEKLMDAQTSFQLQAINLGVMLTDLCGGDAERAKREIRLALDRPTSVVIREANAARAAADAGEQPTVPQLAATAARIIATANAIMATIERKQAGAPLQ